MSTAPENTCAGPARSSRWTPTGTTKTTLRTIWSGCHELRGGDDTREASVQGGGGVRLDGGGVQGAAVVPARERHRGGGVEDEGHPVAQIGRDPSGGFAALLGSDPAHDDLRDPLTAQMPV